ncbi:CLUMA_CG006167, isoform A [Clunio marinus]|uniref:NADH dehydrogenase [ubiquinone] 1 alpha subcomplex subunit 9, mitochondrial n=1 Tax=Clunio marinus TaxID=568069 RepID=A0A1J1HX26_9DIPT|nr:CLUMA_CG006167, isoform A [Clunio marinus]
MASLILFNGAKQHTGFLGVVCLNAKANYSTQPPEIRPLRTTNPAAFKRGTGGRSSFNGIVATVFGASGFLGRYVCNKLGKGGSQIIVPYRGDHYDVLRLKVCGDLGQVLFHPYHLMDDESIRRAVKYSNVVINLIGRDWETRNFSFDEVHNEGPRRLARISREAGVEKFIHVSALNATPNPEPLVYKEGSEFLRSKYAGELAVREEFPEAIIFRPSDIYGQEDRFLRYYAHVWRRMFRFMPLWYNGERTVKQPVFVSDVASGIVNAIKDPDAEGKLFQAVGPRRIKLSELVDWFHRVMRKDAKWWGYHRYDLRFDPTFKLKVAFTEAICPSWPIGYLHHERVEREYATDVVEKSVPTLEDLGVQLTHMEDQVPWELGPYRAGLYYDSAIENFPDEILIELLSYLSVKDLKQVMMTCQLFADVVSGSTKLMKKFIMKVTPKRKWDFKVLTSFVRVHQNVKMTEFKLEDSMEIVIDGLHSIGHNMKHIEVNGCGLSHHDFNQILLTMPQLTHVELDNVAVCGDFFEHSKVPNFLSLTHLKVIESDITFELFKQAQNLHEICFQAKDKNSENLESFEIFLCNQKKLKILELINIRFSNFLTVKRDFPFQLTSLSVHQCHFIVMENYERFLLNQQKLEDVELSISSMKMRLDRTQYFEESFMIIFQIKNLQKVNLNIKDYNFLNLNFLSQFVNRNVLTLSLSIDQENLPIASFLQIFPNVQTLELSVKEIDLKTIEYLNKNEVINSLKVSKFPSEIFGNIKIKNLKSLNICETNIELEHWKQFLGNNSGITKLIINFTFFGDLSDEFVNILTTKLKLEHLELIDKWIGMNNNIYVMICDNSKNLKYLKLWNINIEKDFEDNDKEYLRSRNIKFDLFNDESLNAPMVPF